MKHLSIIRSYNGTPERLANSICKNKNDISSFSHTLSEKLKGDSIADQGRKRPKLAYHLREASRYMDKIYNELGLHLPSAKKYERIAEDTGDMKYNALSDFLTDFEEALKRKIPENNMFYTLSIYASHARDNINIAWKEICEPRMPGKNFNKEQ